MVVNRYTDSEVAEHLQMPLSDRVRNARLAKGFATQTALAKKAKIGQGAVSEIEGNVTKAHNVKAETLIKIAKALGMTAEELHSGRPPEKSQAGIDGDIALALLAQMRQPTREAWFENARALIKLQASVKVAGRARRLHNTERPATPEEAPKTHDGRANPPSVLQRLVSKHGEEQARKLVVGYVEQDVARKARKPRRDRGGAGEQPPVEPKPAETGKRGIDE